MCSLGFELASDHFHRLWTHNWPNGNIELLIRRLAFHKMMPTLLAMLNVGWFKYTFWAFWKRDIGLLAFGRDMCYRGNN